MTIKKTITSEVDVELDFSTPKFFRTSNDIFRITNENIIRLDKSSVITYESKRISAEYFALKVSEFISGEEISETEFNEAFDTVLNKINSLAGISNVPTLQLQEA